MLRDIAQNRSLFNEERESVLHEARSVKTTVGFRVKSGLPASVLLAGPVHPPYVIDHRVINLSDVNMPETKQPYHARAENA